MGKGEVATPTKSDRASSPVQEQPTIHPYPDWAAMQAYYGPGVAMPPPYLTAAVASGHATNPYIWAPQPFMPPYGTPYPAIYTHGVYTHPSVPLGSHSQSQGIAPSPSTNEAVVMATPLSIEPLRKSSGNKGRGLLKKLKGLDGLPVSNGDGNAENTSGGAVNGLSQSGESSADGSSDGSDGSNESGENKTKRREISEDKPISGTDGKAVSHVRETNESPHVPSEVSMAPANITGKPVSTMPSSSPTAGNENRVSVNGAVKVGTAPVPPANSTMVPGHDGVPMELWIQDDRALKRERRKQSNRESARRSRLRKQAETEELAVKVDALGAENLTLRTEIIRLKENSEKLRLENSALTEKLKTAQMSHQVEEASSVRVESESPPSEYRELAVKSRFNSNSVTSSKKQETDAHEKSSGKLHQLFGPSSRTDAVASG